MWVDFNTKLGYKETMNKEQNMTVNRIDTNLVWNKLEVYGKATVRKVFDRQDDFIAQLYDGARDYGVSLSIKRSTSPYHNGRIYIYLRKNCG